MLWSESDDGTTERDGLLESSRIPFRRTIARSNQLPLFSTPHYSPALLAAWRLEEPETFYWPNESQA
jgi:hypothetical protein